MSLTNEDLQAIKELLLPIQKEITSIQLTLENEKLVIRVNILENELRKVKDRLSTIT